jgi:outer membrane autotransporter protein
MLPRPRASFYGLGGALTWLGNNGFYTDAVGRVTWHDSSLSASGMANSPTTSMRLAIWRVGYGAPAPWR